MNTNNPYIGPRTFTEDERDRFYGREREADELLARVLSEQEVVFYAQSGAGKSSLVNTHLIPELREEGIEVLLGRVGGDAPPGLQVDNIFVFNLLRSLSTSKVNATDLSNVSLDKFLALATDGGSSKRRALIIDQFEEIFSTHDEAWEKRREFFKQLARALKADPRLRVVLVMREDFIASLDPYARLLPGRFQARYYMQRLEYAAALKAVTEPVKSGDFSRPYEAGVAEKLVDDLRSVKVYKPDGTEAMEPGQYVEPVQLQVVCYNLWENLSERKKDGKEITEEDLQGVGDVDASLGSYYAGRVKTVAETSNVKERKIREWFADKLISPGGIRNMVLQEPSGKSGGLENNVIHALPDLIRAEHRGGAIFYELTHDRLVAPIIANNKKWEEEHSGPLHKQAALWQGQGRNENWLLSGQALVDVEDWVKDNPDDVTESEEEFLKACRAKQAEHVRITREQAARRLRFLLIGSTIGLVFSIALSLYALQQRDRAIRQSHNAEQARIAADDARINASREATLARAGLLAAKSQIVLDDAPRLSLLLSIESLKLAQQGGQNYFPVAEEILQRAIKKVGNDLPLTGHTGPIRAVEFSADGHWLASAGEDSTIRLWDMTAQYPAAHSTLLRGHNNGVTTLVFSQDGHWLASGDGDATVLLWDLTAKNPYEDPITLSPSYESIFSLAFSSDGHWLASGGNSDTVWLWDLTAEKPNTNPVILRDHTNWIRALAFNTDGHWLASGGDDFTVRLWDLSAKSPNINPIVLNGHTNWIRTLAFSPDGHWLASGSEDSTMRLWDLTAEDPSVSALVLDEHTGSISSLAFSPKNGRWLASGSSDNTVRLWDMHAEDPVASSIRLTGLKGSVSDLAFSPDGNWLASGNDDKTVVVWDISNPNPDLSFELLGTHDGLVSEVAFSPNGKWLASGGDDATVRLWDMSTGNQAKVEEEFSSFERIASLEGHAEKIQSLAFSPDSKWLASSSADATVRLWNFQTGVPDEANSVLEGRYGSIYTLLFPSYESLAGGAENNNFIVWDLHGEVPNEWLYRLGEDGRNITTLAIDPDFRAVVIPDDNDFSIKVWTSETNFHALKGHKDIVHAITFSPDGHRLASGSADGTIILWDIENQQANAIPQSILSGHKGDVNTLAFSPDGKWLASAGSDSTVRLWDFRKGVPSQSSFVLAKHEGPVYSLAFSPSGRWLASAGEDGKVQIWDLSLSDPSAQSTAWDGQSGPLHTIAYSPNARWLVAGGDDTKIQIWGMGAKELINQACKIAKRNLTWQELQEYFRDTPYRKTCSNWPIHPSVAFNLRDQGDQLARLGKLDEAIAKYQEARNIYSEISLIPNSSIEEEIGDPRSRAKAIVAQSLMDAGDELARSGDVEGAVAQYQEALAIDPSISDNLDDLTSRAKDIAVRGLLDAGDMLARSEDVEGAVAQYQEALAIDPSQSETLGDLESRAKGIAAQSLMDAGDELARSGDVEGAVAQYQEALAIDPSQSETLGDLESRAKNQSLVQEISQLVNSGQYKEAVSKFEIARKTDSDIFSTGDANLLNDLCWYGTLSGYASDLKDVCEIAVNLAPEEGYIVDSRALNRALLGDFDGAALDFQFYVDELIKRGDQESTAVQQRQKWISILEDGRNPFTPAVLESLQ